MIAVAQGRPLPASRWRGFSAGSSRAMSSLRSFASDPAREKTGAAQLGITAALVVPAWLALAIAAAMVPSSPYAAVGSHDSTTILTTLAGQLAVGAALLLIIRGWAARDVVPALAGGGFLAYGIHEILLVTNGGSSDPGSPGQILGSISFLLAFGLVLLALVHRSESPSRPITVAVGALLAGLLGLTFIRQAGVGVLSDSNSASTGGNVIMVAAWSAVGLAAIYMGRSERVPLKNWIGFTALCLAQRRLALTVISNHALSILASEVLQTIALSLILLGTVRALQDTLSEGQNRLRESLLAFEGSEARRRREANDHEEAVHNLRNALTSIGSAAHLLVFDRKVPLSDGERTQLTAALMAELDRAKRLLSREWNGSQRRFTLMDVLEPLVANERSQGAVVEVDVPAGTTVVGNPERTYEVLATLFDNARRHAAGAPVTVGTFAAGGGTTVVVEDRGPGLPAQSPERIFDRGWSTSAKREGKGLGLHVARRLMEEQGGKLVASNRPGGGASFHVAFPGSAGATPGATQDRSPIAVR